MKDRKVELLLPANWRVLVFVLRGDMMAGFLVNPRHWMVGVEIGRVCTLCVGPVALSVGLVREVSA